MAQPQKKLGDCEVAIPWEVARENYLINKAGRVPDRCPVNLVMRLAPCLPLPDGHVAPETGTPDERLSVSFARREPVKGSDYVANCRALEREHGNGLSLTLRSALRTATRAKQEWIVGDKPKGPRNLHLTIIATVDGPAPSALAEEEAQQKEAAEEQQQGTTAPVLAGPPMPETPDLIDPADGAYITITPMQLRKNGMLKVAATYHAPAEIKHVPLTVFLDGPPGHVPEGRVQVSDPIQVDLRLQPNEVYTTRMGTLLKGPLAKEWPNATEPERVALLKWVVQDLRWNKASSSFWVKLVPPPQEEAGQQKGSVAKAAATPVTASAAAPAEPSQAAPSTAPSDAPAATTETAAPGTAREQAAALAAASEQAAAPAAAPEQATAPAAAPEQAVAPAAAPEQAVAPAAAPEQAAAPVAVPEHAAPITVLEQSAALTAEAAGTDAGVLAPMGEEKGAGQKRTAEEEQVQACDQPPAKQSRIE